MRKKQFIATLAITSTVVLLAAGCSSNGSRRSSSREQLTIEQAFTMKTNKGQKPAVSRSASASESQLATVEKNSCVMGCSLTDQMNSSTMSTGQKIALITSQVDAITTTNVNQTMGGKLPNYLHNPGFNMDVDFLYWRTDVESAQIGQVVKTTSDSGQTVFKNHQVGFEGSFDPGFRLQFGYTFANVDQWDMLLDWTYFHNTNHVSESVPSSLPAGTTEEINPSWAATMFPVENQSASGHWRLNYNTLDWNFGRNFFISKSISTRLHWGLRAAWLYQEYRSSYTSSDTRLGVTPIESRFNADNEFHAVGLRTGTDIRWGFNRHWAFVGNIALSLLYGRFQIQETASVNMVDGVGKAATVTQPFNFNAVRPEIEAAFGLEWCSFFYNNKYRFAISALWEIQEWFEQNMLNGLDQPFNENFVGISDYWQPINVRLNGNLGIQGFTLKFRLDF